MSDLELLELAAKAAGLRFQVQDELPIASSNDGIGWLSWNPLTDDGDALRLAVKLRISVAFWDEDVSSLLPPINMELPEAYGSDPYAATRRAIVRAAAEIGRHV